MKVNEIINEGPMWDKMKAAAAGGVKRVAANAGAGLGIQAGVNAKQKINAVDSVNKAVKQVNADWATQKAQLAAGGTPPTAETFKQFMAARTPSVAPATDADFANPAAYIQKAVAQHFVNYNNGIKTYAPPAADPATAQPAATAPAVTTPKVAGISLIHSEPDIIEYKKVAYVVNDQGLWSPINSNKPVNQAMQAFLTKQADALTGGAA